MWGIFDTKLIRKKFMNFKNVEKNLDSFLAQILKQGKINDEINPNDIMQ